MLPRRSHFLPPLLLSIAILASLWTGATPLETTLTVDLTDDEARNALHRAPAVCSVKFIYPTGYTYRDQTCLPLGDNNCTVTRNGSSLNAVFTKEDSPDITFEIIFDFTVAAGCSSYIPNVRFAGQGSLTLSCSPVFPCDDFNRSSNVETVQWWRFADESVRDSFLNATDKANFTSQHLVNTTNNILEVNETTGDLEMFFTAAKYEVTGYYVTTFPLSGQGDLNGQPFIVYSNPDLDASSGDEELIFGNDEASDFTKIFCRFVSFPPANITWQGPSGSSFTMEDTGDALTLTSDSDPTLSLGGRLRFEEVRYEDGGKYTCTAKHPISGVEESHSLRLRVRNPLRPLWPALGILCSFIITFLCISGGALVDRVRGKHSVDDDDGSFTRNYSMVSNLGEESGSGDSKHTRKHQSAGKRISITQQELLANASDLN